MADGDETAKNPSRTASIDNDRRHSPSKAHLIVMHDQLITDKASKEEEEFLFEKQTINETGRNPNNDDC